jgi:hypothetical protein
LTHQKRRVKASEKAYADWKRKKDAEFAAQAAKAAKARQKAAGTDQAHTNQPPRSPSSPVSPGPALTLEFDL